MRWIRSVTMMACVGAFAGACRETPLLAPQPGVVANVPGGAVRADIVEQPLALDGSVTFVVRVRSRNVALSAFQGAVTFTPGSFDLVSIDVPVRDGESYLFNPEEVAAGRIRFAALSPTSFAESYAQDGVETLRITVRPRRPVAEAALAATLDVASVESGAALDTEQLLPSRYVKPSKSDGTQ